jgi:hypothetical protein
MMNMLASVTKDAQKVKVGFGKWLKVYFADEPNGPVVVTLDIPGAWAKYLCVEVGAFVFTAKFCLLAIR